ncbi:hypothetical protein MNEG_16583 [Monoraphidium neglectum]|uniref:Uncharacterized protein n=1 Tax=Monoraphidium neglectum TaxID=145388 RepID=A0A0D2LMW4_9CHLO|nr:hypothetical protein MNEG_16583 [Monoraphidium neglectum]KIY91381.1 hypothetical protein MNEG_16583 [Monoraphidium neglectum]|eukprot:XP_013890401.1 hypothetical protein MNEG_16583 [Monoraphidium neglectum]
MSVLQSLAGTIEPSPLSKYELERLDRIEANRRRMEELGVLETARSLMDAINASKPPPRAPRPHKPKVRVTHPAD